MSSKTIFCAALALGISANVASAVDYGQLMAKKVKAVLGSKVKKYTFSTYPVDNFGLGTAYDGKVDATKEICATWDCLGLSDDTKVAALSDEQRLKVVAGGIQYGEVATGVALSLTEDEKHSIGLNAVLPKLLQVLDITGDFSYTNDVTVTLTLGPVSIRTLRRQAMMDKLNSDSAHPLEKTVWNNGKGTLVLAYSDVILSSMKIEVKVNPETKADLDAKLNGALQGKAGQVIGTGSDLSFKLDNSTKGDYTLEIAKPMILAVYTKKQPAKGVLGAEGGWNDWKDFNLGTANKVQQHTVDLGDVQ